MAIVAKPEEIDRVLVNKLHRMTRKLTDTPYGDCLWGIITGATAADAEIVADTSETGLVLKRAMGTTNFEHNFFEKSFMITDWGPNEYWQQANHGETEGKKTREESPEGMAFLFNEKWKEIDPQMVISSSHATQYNLEMPFSKGLIVSMNGRYNILRQDQLKSYARFVKGALFDGEEGKLKEFIDELNPPQMPLSDTPKVWVAAGNCLFGDAKKSSNSMVVTALGPAARCRQVVGYTVPTWYGQGGWGTLARFFNNTSDTTLAQAWYLNNQMILHSSLTRFPQLLEVEFNGIDISKGGREFIEALKKYGYEKEKDAMGMAHDRDVVAFYGNPKFAVNLDPAAPEKTPWECQGFVEKNGREVMVVTANKDFKGPFGYYYPQRRAANAQPLMLEVGGKVVPVSKVGVETRDFIIIQELDLKKGEKAYFKRG